MPRKPNKQNNIRKDLPYKKVGIIKKKKVVVRQRVARTRNANTWTEAEYFQKVRSSLRTGFRYWRPIMLALERVSRPYKGMDKRIKKEYQCNCCKKWFVRTGVQVDHLEECGSLNCYEDIVPFLMKLTREEPEAYQVLCRNDHRKKTKLYLDNKKRINHENKKAA